MTLRDMADLVRKDRSDFVVVGCDVEQTAVDVNRAARESERVDVLRIDDLELIPKRGQRPVLNDPPADNRYVTSDIVGLNEGKLIGFFRSLRPDLHVLLEREEINALAVRQEKERSQQ